MFYDKGFDVVDRQLVQALKGESDYTQALSGDVSAASKIASMLGADIIVIGTAKISSGGVIGAGNFQMTSGQADINGKIVRADTGELLAIVPQARGKKPHISPSTAGINAANEASSILGSDINTVEKNFEENKSQYECFIANDNSNGQVVISGKLNDLDQLVDELKKTNIKNIKLQVSAPFHCQLMSNATEIMRNQIHAFFYF